MAYGYWRIKADGGVISLQDHTPNGTAREDLVVKINTPGRHTAAEEETLIDTADDEVTDEQEYLNDNGWSYYLSQPWSFPISINPGDVGSITTTTFPDGVYRLQVDYNIGADAYEFDEYFLITAKIDECISTKLETYLASSCHKCKSTQQLQTLQELVSLRQGAQLDINRNRITAAEEKLTLMSNICTGSGCSCICGC